MLKKVLGKTATTPSPIGPAGAVGAVEGGGKSTRGELTAQLTQAAVSVEKTWQIFWNLVPWGNIAIK